MASPVAQESATASPSSATPATNVNSILTSVGRLLMDFAIQLRDDVGPFQLPATDGTVTHHESTINNHNHAGAVSQTEALRAEEETMQLTEADVAECRARLHRLKRVRHLLLLHSKGFSSPGGGSHSDALAALPPGHNTTSWKEGEESKVIVQDCSATIRRNVVLTTVLGRLERLSRQFQGMSNSTASFSSHSPRSITNKDVRSGAQVISAPTGSTPDPAVSIQPLLKPVSLAEGALAAFSRNVGVVFRRRPASAAAASPQTSAHVAQPTQQRVPAVKRVREEDSEGKQQLNYWTRLASKQRKSRFAVYTLRTALLPYVDRVCAPLYVSPAVQELAQLNLAAEQAMLQRAWCVFTKAHVLREAPSLARDVESTRESMREALKGFSPAQQEAFLHDIRYMECIATDEGILRVCVQHALFLDLTYDLKRKQWTVLRLHWNLYTSAAGASLVSSTLTTTAPSPSHASSLSESTATSADHQQLLPENTTALVAFLQTVFQQAGLSGGLRAANRLVCAVVLDALALQLQRLQQTFFTGSDLGRLVDVEVRPGTFISVHLSLPEVFYTGEGGAATAADVVHLKIAVWGCTVAMERVRGTDLSTRTVTLLLGTSSLVTPPDSAAGGPLRVVVDMEALLWQSVCADR